MLFLRKSGDNSYCTKQNNNNVDNGKSNGENNNPVLLCLHIPLGASPLRLVLLGLPPCISPLVLACKVQLVVTCSLFYLHWLFVAWFLSLFDSLYLGLSHGLSLLFLFIFCQGHGFITQNCFQVYNNQIAADEW